MKRPIADRIMMIRLYKCGVTLELYEFTDMLTPDWQVSWGTLLSSGVPLL
ncbi:hypothetical protein QM565_24730 [Geitlerinema splendidum]|nr:hypothetical protein [Geitlerinema splendidum]